MVIDTEVKVLGEKQKSERPVLQRKAQRKQASRVTWLIWNCRERWVNRSCVAQRKYCAVGFWPTADFPSHGQVCRNTICPLQSQSTKAKHFNKTIFFIINASCIFICTERLVC